MISDLILLMSLEECVEFLNAFKESQILLSFDFLIIYGGETSLRTINIETTHNDTKKIITYLNINDFLNEASNSTLTKSILQKSFVLKLHNQQLILDKKLEIYEQVVELCH